MHKWPFFLVNLFSIILYFLCTYKVLANIVLHKRILAGLFAELSAHKVQGLAHVQYVC